MKRLKKYRLSFEDAAWKAFTHKHAERRMVAILATTAVVFFLQLIIRLFLK